MPKGIAIVGLGPGEPGLLTTEAQQVLQAAQDIYLRTRQHPTVAALPPSAAIHSFDDVYKHAGTLEEVYAEIFSDEELDDLIVLHSNPAIKKLRGLNSEIVHKILEKYSQLSGLTLSEHM